MIIRRRNTTLFLRIYTLLTIIDPDGNDIIVLNDSNGANFAGINFGHMAVLIGNDKTGWIYVSKDGRAQSTNPNDKGQDGTILTGGKSTQTIINSQKDESFKTLKGALGSDVLKRYDKAFQIETSADQDKTATGKAIGSAKSDYSVINNNCADVATDALESVDKNGGTETIAVGNGRTGEAKPIAPNSRFDLIKENNEGKDIEIKKKEEDNN